MSDENRLYIAHRRQRIKTDESKTVDNNQSGTPSLPPAVPMGPPSSAPKPLAGLSAPNMPPSSAPKPLAGLSAPNIPPAPKAPVSAASSNDQSPLSAGQARGGIMKETENLFAQKQKLLEEREKQIEEEVKIRVAKGELEMDARKAVMEMMAKQPTIVSTAAPPPPPANNGNVVAPAASAPVANASTSYAKGVLDEYLKGIQDHSDFDDDLGAAGKILVYYAKMSADQVGEGSKLKIEDYLDYNKRTGKKLPKIDTFLHGSLYKHFVKDNDNYDSVADFVTDFLEQYFNYFRKRGGVDNAIASVKNTLDKVLKKENVPNEQSSAKKGTSEDEDLRDYFEKVLIYAYLINRDAITKTDGVSSTSNELENEKKPQVKTELKEPPKEQSTQKGGMTPSDIADLVVKLMEDKYLGNVTKTVGRIEKTLNEKLDSIVQTVFTKLGYVEQKLGFRVPAFIDLITANDKKYKEMTEKESQYKIFALQTGTPFFWNTRKEYAWLKQNIAKDDTGAYDQNQALDANIAVPGFEKPLVKDLVTVITTYATELKDRGFEGVKSNSAEDLINAYVELKATILDLGLVEKWKEEIDAGLTKK